MNAPERPPASPFVPEDWVPPEIGKITNHQTDLPRIARDPALVRAIEARLPQLPTVHDIFRHDSRMFTGLAPESVHLVVTSPPYWTLKQYREHLNQMGYIGDYECFLDELDKVWRICFDALVPGGRLVCVVGDDCLSRRKNKGEHVVVPLHASIQEHSTRDHPAPYPMELAERLIRMFSFVGDAVLDPFLGTGTTTIAAATWGRNSIGIEVDPIYFESIGKRIDREMPKLFAQHAVRLHRS